MRTEDGFPSTDANGDGANVRWGRIRLILFRFVFVYLTLYSFPFPLDFIPYVNIATGYYRQAWVSIVPWVGEHALRLPEKITILPNGSGDTTYNYVQLLCYAAIALSLTLVWSLVDRKRDHSARLHELLRIYVRYVLATTMLSYGMAKVIQSQFPAPSLDRLMQPYGESSPMGLLWTFMGASRWYNAFTGAAEVLGGALLFFRRTTTLGSLVSIGVLSNVVALNFCYDVPVKQYSAHLLLMALFLALPDVPRLLSMFVLNRPVSAVRMDPRFRKRWLRWSTMAIKAVMILALGSMTALTAWSGYRRVNPNAPKPALYGVYEVDEFTKDGAPVPPSLTEKSRWKRVAVGRSGYFLSVRRMDDTVIRYRIQADVEKKTLSLTPFSEEDTTARTLTWAEPDADHVELQGAITDGLITARLRRIPDTSFLLTSRGFHWISEYPFNR